MKSSYNLYQEKSYGGLVHWDPVGRAARILRDSEEKGFYKMPDLKDQFFPGVKSREIDVNLPEEDDKIASGIDVTYIPSRKAFFIKDGWAIVKNQNSQGNKIFVVLKSEWETKIFETVQASGCHCIFQKPGEG